MLCRDYEIGLGDHMAIKDEDGPISDLISLNYMYNIPEQLCLRESQAISTLCYVETMKSVLVTIWPSRPMMVQLVIFFL